MTLAGDLDGDLGDLLNTDEFATAATYKGFSKSASGNQVALTKTVNVIFDRGYVPASPETAEVALTRPTALARLSDLPDVATGDTLTISGTAYHLVGVEPSGVGDVILLLSEDEP